MKYEKKRKKKNRFSYPSMGKKKPKYDDANDDDDRIGSGSRKKMGKILYSLIEYSHP